MGSPFINADIETALRWGAASSYIQDVFVALDPLVAVDFPTTPWYADANVQETKQISLVTQECNEGINSYNIRTKHSITLDINDSVSPNGFHDFSTLSSAISSIVEYAEMLCQSIQGDNGCSLDSSPHIVRMEPRELHATFLLATSVRISGRHEMYELGSFLHEPIRPANIVRILR